jgi:leader peptidase (prepilin peptidase)/N-methyltransferase
MVPPDSLLERIASWPWAELATILFGFAWGAMLGSFVNVIVHRLPRGESVVFRRSRCPRCGSPVRPGDNIPVFGWLRLQGRCRDCRAAIAMEYPLVEAACGLAAGVLAATHLAGGGRWQPRLAESFPTGIDRLLRGDWRLVVAWALHAGVVLVIVVWSLLERRGWSVRGRSLAVSLAAALAVIGLVPAVGPPGVLAGGGDWPAGPAREPTAAAALLAALAGTLAGGLLGRAASSRGVRLGLPLLGSVLGWQGVTVVAIVTVALDRAGGARGGAAGRPGLVLAALATLSLAFHGLVRDFLTLAAGETPA